MVARDRSDFVNRIWGCLMVCTAWPSAKNSEFSKTCTSSSNVAPCTRCTVTAYLPCYGSNMLHGFRSCPTIFYRECKGYKEGRPMWQDAHAGMSGNCERHTMPTFGTAICSFRRGIVSVRSEPSTLNIIAFTRVLSSLSSTISCMCPRVPFTNSVAIS